MSLSSPAQSSLSCWTNSKNLLSICACCKIKVWSPAWIWSSFFSLTISSALFWFIRWCDWEWRMRQKRSLKGWSLFSSKIYPSKSKATISITSSIATPPKNRLRLPPQHTPTNAASWNKKCPCSVDAVDLKWQLCQWEGKWGPDQNQVKTMTDQSAFHNQSVCLSHQVKNSKLRARSSTRKWLTSTKSRRGTLFNKKNWSTRPSGLS